jgi:hypothetical protein
MRKKFWSGNLNRLLDLGVDRKNRINLGNIGWKDVDWIHLAQVRDQWRVLLNTVRSFRVL